MKDRNHNCQEKTNKTTNNDPLQNNTHRKLKIEQHEPNYKPNINSGICFLFFQEEKSRFCQGIYDFSIEFWNSLDSVIFFLFHFIPDITSSGRTRVNVMLKSWSHAVPENYYLFSIYSVFSCDSTNLIVLCQNAAWVNLQTVYTWCFCEESKHTRIIYKVLCWRRCYVFIDQL